MGRFSCFRSPFCKEMGNFLEADILWIALRGKSPFCSGKSTVSCSHRYKRVAFFSQWQTLLSLIWGKSPFWIRKRRLLRRRKVTRVANLYRRVVIEVYLTAIAKYSFELEQEPLWEGPISQFFLHDLLNILFGTTEVESWWKTRWRDRRENGRPFALCGRPESAASLFGQSFEL